MKLYKFISNEIRFVRISLYKIFAIPAILIIFLFIYLCLITKKFSNSKLENYSLNKELLKLNKDNDELLSIIELINESNDFNEENLFIILQGLNVKYPHIAIAQSKLETNNWKSDIFIESGNLFGMKPAKLRPHTHYGEHRGHADYKGNWKLSIIDYALWQSREAKNVKSEEQYFFLLDKIYAEDSNYIYKLKKLIKNK